MTLEICIFSALPMRGKLRNLLARNLIERADASGLYFRMARIAVRYQSHVFGTLCSNRAFAQGSNRRARIHLSVGAGFFSRIPTSPFASEVRCADSMLRATLSFPCFVDSRISFPAT